MNPTPRGLAPATHNHGRSLPTTRSTRRLADVSLGPRGNIGVWGSPQRMSSIFEYVTVKHIIFLGLPLPNDVLRRITSFLCPAGARVKEYPWYRVHLEHWTFDPETYQPTAGKDWSPQRISYYQDLTLQEPDDAPGHQHHTGFVVSCSNNSSSTKRLANHVG